MSSVGRISLFLLLLSLPLSAYSDGLEPIPGRPEIKHRERTPRTTQSQHGIKNSAQNPPANESLNCKARDQKRDYCSEQKPEKFSWDWWTDSPQTITNFILVFLTGTAAWGAICAARAGTRQANIAEENMHAGLRAWLLMESPTLQLDNLPNEAMGRDIPHVVFRFNFRNAGRTPGTIKRLRFKFEWYTNLPVEPDYSEAKWEEATRRVQIAGDGLEREYTTGLHTAHLTTEERKTTNPQSTLHCFGILEYSDIFNEPRETGFCYRIRTVVTPPDTLVVGGDSYNYNK